MSVTVVVGTQWGDEGKGKIVDYLAADADLIIRYQGGSNAGHTVVVGSDTFKLHLIPSGILRPGKICVMADGTLVDPSLLSREIDALVSRGIAVDGLVISGAAHVILPYHPLLDELEEKLRGERKIGTTIRGVGPAYVDKAKRCGIRVFDLLNPAVLRKKVEDNLREKNVVLQHLYGHRTLTVDEVVESVLEVVPRIQQFVMDARSLVCEAVAQGKNVLLEGAQATFLDIDYGAYPNVTCSHPVAGGACLGTGVGPTQVSRIIGVAKAYTTRVGSGPFPTELDNEVGERLREDGREYGTTTGRPRRCGWLDAPMLRTAARVNGLTDLALTKFDVLDELDTIEIAVGYRVNGEVIDYVPADEAAFARCVPIYERLPGWRTSTREVRRVEDLPPEARAYVERIQEIAGVPVGYVATGPERSEIIESETELADISV